MQHAVCQSLCPAGRRLKKGKQRAAPGPVDGAVAQGVDAVGQRVALARAGVTPSKHDRLQAAIQLGQRDLHRSILQSVHACRRHGYQAHAKALPRPAALRVSDARPAARPARGARPAQTRATPPWSGTPAAAIPGTARSASSAPPPPAQSVRAALQGSHWHVVLQVGVHAAM